MPEAVHYHQRRNAFRAQLKQTDQVKIELAGDKLRSSIPGQLLDISATGCKLRLPGNVASSLHSGQVYERFTAQLPFGEMTTAVELRHVQYEEKLDTTFAGVRFHRMNGLEQRQVERFVYQLQREARRFDSDGLF
jgi:c-di-GMP-binding flagellar brake protein YcgR